MTDPFPPEDLRTGDALDDDMAVVAMQDRLYAMNRLILPDRHRTKTIRAELVASVVSVNEKRASTPASVVRVLIIANSPVVQRGLATCLELEEGIDVVAVASTPYDEERLAPDVRPNVALIGINQGVATILALVRDVQARWPSTPIIVIAAEARDIEHVNALRVGAVAYCGQDVDVPDLVTLIRRAANGEGIARPLTFPNRTLRRPSPRRADSWATQHGGLLTVREVEILQKVSEGLTNTEIADVLGTSRLTIMNHITEIRQKLSAGNNDEAVIAAIRGGMLPTNRSALDRLSNEEDDDFAAPAGVVRR